MEGTPAGGGDRRRGAGGLAQGALLLRSSSAGRNSARRNNRQILVFHGTRATAVLPDRDVELGTVDVGDRVIYHVVEGRIEVEHRRAAASPSALAGEGGA